MPREFVEYLQWTMRDAQATYKIRITYRRLQEAKHAYRLQELIQIIVKISRLLGGVYIGVKFLRVCLDQRRLFELCVLVQISEAYPIVERNSASKEEERK